MFRFHSSQSVKATDSEQVSYIRIMYIIGYICGIINRNFKHKTRKNLRIEMYKTIAVPTLLNASESWVLTKRQESQITIVFLFYWTTITLVVPVITFFTTSYVVPLALICGLYLCMLMRLWRGVAPGGHCSAESRRGKKRVTRMVVVVVAIFAICWCPIQVILVLKSVDKYEITNTSVMIQIVSHVLAYMNSCVNPILYAFLSENFRKAFRKVIYCGPDRGNLPGHINGRPDVEKSALTKTTRTNDIL